MKSSRIEVPSLSSSLQYCIIQFYLPIQEELKPYSPVLKFLAVKSVVFLTFWQDSFLSLLVSFKVIKPTEYMTSDEIQVGINALLETFEMVIFGFLHIKAFTYLIYRPADHKRVTKRGAAMLHVIDFRDWFFEMKRSTKYVTAKSRGRDFTLVEDIRADKYRHLQKALGRDRKSEFEQRIENEKLENALDFWKDPNYVAPEDLDEEGNEKDGGSTTDVERTAGRNEFKVERGYKLKNGSKVGTNSNSDSTPRTGTKSLDVDEQDQINALAYSRGDAHPELSQYHLYGTQNLGNGEFDDPSIARGFAEEVEQELWGNGGGSSKKGIHQYSRPTEQEDPRPRNGTGKERTWWRSIKERISGSLGGGEVDAQDHFQRNQNGPQDQMYAKPSRETEEMDEKAGFLASPPEEDEDLAISSPDAKGAIPLPMADPIGRHHHHHDSPLSQFISNISSPTESSDNDKYTQLPPRRSRASLNREGGGGGGSSSPTSLRDPSSNAQKPLVQSSRRGSNSPLDPPPQSLALQPQVTLVRDNSLAAVSSKQGSVSAYVSSNQQHGPAPKVTPQAYDPAPIRSSPSISFAPSINTFGRGAGGSPINPPANSGSNASASGAAPLSIGTSSSQQRIMRSMSGMKGKAINLVLPTPLQPESYPFGTEGPSPEALPVQAPLREPSPPPNASPAALNDKMERWLSTNASATGSISASSRQSGPVGPVHKKALEMKGKDSSRKTLESTKSKAGAKIVAGAQSLAQVRQEEEQESARLEAEKKWQNQQDLSQKAVDWAAMQSRHGNSRIMDHQGSNPNQSVRGRERRTSAPPVPPSSFRNDVQVEVPSPKNTEKSKAKKKKDKKNDSPMIPLPAPSQFIANDGDAFKAAAAAQVQTPDSNPNTSSRPRLSLDSSTRPSPNGFMVGVGTGLQVGTIVSPTAYPSAPGFLPQAQGRHPSNQPQRQHPGNDYWSRHGYQQQQQLGPSRRYTDQQSYFPPNQTQSPQRYPPQHQPRPSNSRPRQSYDGPRGEPRWDGGQRESAWAREEEMRRREMAARSQAHQQQQNQQRRTSGQQQKPTGFQFEYLD